MARSLNATSRAGLSSFLPHLADDLRTDGADRDEAWASPWARGAGAAISRHVVIHAKLRPLPLFEAHNLSHSALLSVGKNTKETHAAEGFLIRG